MSEENTLREKLDDWAFDNLPLSIYRTPTVLSDFWHYQIKRTFQKVFRRNHTSDMEIWNLYNYLARHLYRKIKAFKDANRVGYPMGYTNPEDWEEDLDKILFAFEFITIQEKPVKNKKRRSFFDRLGITDFEAEVEENKKEITDSTILSFLKDDEKFYYHNSEVEQQLYNRAQEGFDLFGKNFLSLWD